MVEKDYSAHINRVSSNIQSTVEDKPTQPILFFGSGISIRYFDGPSWKELLRELGDRCPEVERDINYYLQRGDSEAEVGTHLSEKYYDWAYGSGEDRFPDSLFNEDRYGGEIFIKYEVAEYFKEITPNSLEDIDDVYKEEIELLQQINPHAIITTNYDPLLELIFPDYEPIIGEQVLTSAHQNVGEIFKIHGCVTEPEKLVLTKQDYEEWKEKKKYISAKLLTYLSEHPVLIAGYSINDENIRRIFEDINQILTSEDSVAENIFFLNYEDQEEIAERDVFDSQKRFETIDGENILLNYITANGFERVFKSFGEGGSIKGVNLKLLRSVMANAYDVVATKAPRKEVEINYKMLKNAAESEDAVGTMFGVSLLDNAPDLSIYYRYRTTDIAEELGYSHFNYIVQIIERIEEETGVDIRDSNNQYHIDIGFNSDQPKHRYSDAALDLITKADEGKEYELNLNEMDLEVETGEPLLAEAD